MAVPHWRGTIVTELLLAAAVLGSISDRPVLELRVKTYASIDAANLAVAQQTAEAVLASGGLQIAWRICGDGDCTDSTSGAHFLVVRLLPIMKQLDPSVTGEVVRDRATARPQIFVYLARNAAMAEQMRQVTGYLVGLTIAHEVGHALGLVHSRSGPMKAQFNPADIAASRTTPLEFTKEAGKTMRESLGLVR